MEPKMPEYIQRFQKLGLGLFVHFGLYSLIGKGEWYLRVYNNPDFSTSALYDKNSEYNQLIHKFKIKKNWAKELVSVAKKMGARYITLTTRHHEGFSLYDTCGLNDFDAPHSASHRDLVKEFVDECNKAGIIPFFYHTLLDWYNSDYRDDFPKYIDYLIKSVEILCKNYGTIGGLWFDGYWDKPNADWQFDRLYKTIRKYQPNAIIINNTGLNALGEVTNYEIDAVTFERGKPFEISTSDGKIRIGEVCDGITDHWGYTKNDVKIKSVSQLIDELIDCRRFGCNFLINSGPRGDGSLNPVEKYTLMTFGNWVRKYQHIILDAKISDIQAENAYLFNDDKYYYAIIKDVPMSTDENVTRKLAQLKVKVLTDRKILNPVFLDDNCQKIVVNKKDNSFDIMPFCYGTSLYARIARFKLK